MRKEAKTRQNVSGAYIQGYHSDDNYTSNQSYAYAGFQENLYFNSDRAIRLDENYNRVDGQPLSGYGLEIETECHTISRDDALAEIMEKVVFPNFKFGKKMFKMQEDGSLGGDTSVEVITQVMTKGRIRNDYAAYQTMFNKYFPTLGISADARNTNCGMHVNVSNAVFGKTKDEQDDAIRKLYYVINRHYKFFCKAFYRPSHKTEWCGEMSYDNLACQNQYYWSREDAQRYAWPNAKSIDLNGNVPKSHGNCVNLSHYSAGRIEIRLPGGQDTYIRFRNTMETVFFLTENIRKVKWDDLDDLVKVFKGCNDYVCKRIRDCIGIGGFTAEMFHEIEDHAKHEDLELRFA